MSPSLAETTYNQVYQGYSESKKLPFRAVESFTFLSLLESLKLPEGCVMLDAACGDGFYTRICSRLLKTKLAVGVDISEKMIGLAKAHQGNGEEYIYCDAKKMRDSHFQESVKSIAGCGLGFKADVVTCTYLFNYARSFDELKTFIASIASVLKSGCFIVGINDNPRDDPSKYYGQSRLVKYGLEKRFENENTVDRKEGEHIVYSFFNPESEPIEIVNFWISAKEFERAFFESGFVDFRWVDLEAPSEAIDVDYSELLALKPFTCFIARKRE